LLDAVVDYLPSPLDVPPVAAHHPKTGEVETREASDFEPLTALVFKIATDPYVGKLHSTPGFGTLSICYCSGLPRWP